MPRFGFPGLLGGGILVSSGLLRRRAAFVDWGSESSRVILYGVQLNPVDGLTPVVRANRGHFVYLWFARRLDVG